MKKKISLLAVLVMLISLLVPVSVSAEYKDVKPENQYYEAITTLSKLTVIPVEVDGKIEMQGVINGYEDGTFVPQGLITRAEFTKMLVFALGLQNIAVEPTEFTDVSDCWAKCYIKTAYDRGIINGMGDGIFAPNNNVTYEQALKMVVCLLGYESYAEANGGYPDGYTNQASVLGLTKNISGVKFKEEATRGVIAQLVYNALEVEMKEYNPLTGKTSSSNETLLGDYLNVKKLKGVLVGAAEYKTGDCTQNITKNEMDVLGSSNEGEVIIRFDEYTENITDISKYLGKNIVVYYKQQNDYGERFLMTIDDETATNTDYSIKYYQIESFDGSSLKYRENSADKLRSLKFSNTDITVRYNGKVVRNDVSQVLEKKKFIDGKLETITADRAYDFSSMLNAWLNPNNAFFIYGEVICTDRNSDGDINDIQINDYNTIVALKKPSTSDYKISDKIITANNIILNPDSNDYTYTVVKGGKQIEVTSIAAGDVILYTKSLDGTLYACEVTDKKVTGTIDSIDDVDNTVDIDGTEYDIGEMCRYYISTNQNGKSLATGQKGTFYLDKYDTIVYATIEDEAEKPYAYITNAFTSDDGETQYVSVFVPSSNSTSNYQLKDKVKLNGSSVSAAKAVNELTKISSGAVSDSAAVKFSNNDMTDLWHKTIYKSVKTKMTSCSLPARIEIKNNEVTSIATIASNDDSYYDENGYTLVANNEDTSKLVRCKDLDYYKYSSNSFTLNGKSAFSINAKTTIIYVPADRTEKSKYTKKSTSSFSSGDSYYVEAYDINTNKVAGLVLMYSATNSSITSVSKSSNYSVVGKLPSTFFDEDLDGNTKKLSVYTASTTLKDWVTLEEDEFADCEVGDVIQFAYDSDNYIQGRRNIIKYSDILGVLGGTATVVSEGEEDEHSEVFNWAQSVEPTEENYYQRFKFDFRYPKANASSTGDSWYETYTSSSDGVEYAYSRAAMYNVMQVQLEENKLLVTQGGFIPDTGELYNENDYEEVVVSSSTKILRMADKGKSLTPYVEDTTTNLSIEDFKASINYGTDCSKILVCSARGSAKLIVMYN